MPAVLLITRDSSTEALAERALVGAGYEVVPVQDCEGAMRTLFNVQVDVVVLDSGVGKEGVAEFRSWVRERDGSLPVVFLASAGARWLPGYLPVEPELDEVVVKPCGAQEIRQAVERSLSVANRARPEVVTIGELQLDRPSHELRGEGVVVSLTPTEFRLLEYLAQRQGAIVSTEELLAKVWQFYPGTGSSELVRSHIRNLRRKLRLAARDRELIQTVPRRGYRLA